MPSVVSPPGNRGTGRLEVAGSQPLEHDAAVLVGQLLPGEVPGVEQVEPAVGQPFVQVLGVARAVSPGWHALLSRRPWRSRTVDSTDKGTGCGRDWAPSAIVTVTQEESDDRNDRNTAGPLANADEWDAGAAGGPPMIPPDDPQSSE